MNIKNNNIAELEKVCQDIRERILEVVSKNGGHLSSTLGATEIIVAMHKVFDSEENPFIFDVSHQAYAHKLLTGRWLEFESLRQFGGLSGYTKPSESKHDFFVAGHSSTSISLGVGAAKSIALKGQSNTRVPIALIGDGSLTAGMVYEAMNELGDLKLPLIIILNDNEMSIAKPIGAISRVLSSAMAGPFYQKFRNHTKHFLENFGEGAHYIGKRLEESLKLITPGLMFEEMGIEYIGPIDGHNLTSLIETLEKAKALNKPVIIHAQTLKGKGYEIAEGQHEKWHGVGPFDRKSGDANKKVSSKSATQIYTEALLHLANHNEKIVGVTAAMPSGTGMSKLLETYPERFWDVAIAEQHAVTSMAAMAAEGFKPFCTIYSTFMQRAYDQVIHDICLMDLPVVLTMDRAGIVGEDGETHQGVFDVSFLRAIPNMTLLAPRDEKSFHQAMGFAASYDHPCGLRYPRGSFYENDLVESTPFVLGKSQLLRATQSNVLFIGYGNGVGRAEAAAQLMDSEMSLLDLRFVKPLDEEMLSNLSKTHKQWFVFSDTSKAGGVASALLEFLNDQNILDVSVHSFEYSDKFITHGNTTKVEESLGLLPSQLAQSVKEIIKA